MSAVGVAILWSSKRVPQWVTYILFTLSFTVQFGILGAIMYDPNGPGTLHGSVFIGSAFGLFLGVWLSLAPSTYARWAKRWEEYKRQRGW